MAKLSKKDVLKLAQLARLELSEEEQQSFTQEINEILKYVEQLQSVDVEGIEPTSQVTGLENVTRDDVISKNRLSQDDLLKNVPDITDDGYIKVKRIL